MTRRIFHTSILRIENKKMAARGTKNPDGTIDLQYDDLGYFATVLLGNQSFSFYIGDTAPDDLAVGDRIDLILEKPAP